MIQGGEKLNTEEIVKYVTKLVIDEIQNMESKEKTIPVGISARHVHLSKNDVETLFGRGQNLSFFKALSQPGQFAANETVELVGPKGTIKKVRVLGPERSQSQVEVANSDLRTLGVNAPVRNSGDLHNTPGLVLRGPKGEVKLLEGVIVPERHVHMSIEDAARFQLEDGDLIKVFVQGPKGGTLEQIKVRVKASYALDLHIDTDDSNAFGLTQGQMLRFEKL